jgi:hypothetical protein
MYTVVVYAKRITPSDNDVGCGLEHGVGYGLEHGVHDACREPNTNLRVLITSRLRGRWQCQNLIWTTLFVLFVGPHSIPSHSFLTNVEHFGEMDPDSYTSNNPVERELRRRILEVEEDRNRLRRLLSEAEAKAEANNLQGKLAYLDMENKYERERAKRINVVR